jgi:hypothetical protein
MSRTFKTVDDDQALDLTVPLGDCLPPDLPYSTVSASPRDDMDRTIGGNRERGTNALSQGHEVEHESSDDCIIAG